MVTSDEASPTGDAAQGPGVPPKAPEGGLPVTPKRVWSKHLDRQYEVFREYLKHEDNLISHRATWHATWQGLLFTALGIVIHSGPEDNSGNWVYGALRFVLPFTGLVVAIAGLFTIRAALVAIDNLDDQWDQVKKHYKIDNHLRVVLPIVPALTAGGSTDRLKSKHWKLLNLVIPFVAGVMWVGVGIATVAQQLAVKQPSTPQKVVIENLGDLTGQEKLANELNQRLSAIENQLKQIGKTPSGPAVRNGQSRRSAKRKTVAH